MNEEFRKMMEANRKMIDRQGFVSDGYKKLFGIGKGVLTGENNLVDLKEAEIDINYNADFGANIKGAREIIGEMRSIKKQQIITAIQIRPRHAKESLKNICPRGFKSW